MYSPLAYNEVLLFWLFTPLYRIVWKYWLAMFEDLKKYSLLYNYKSAMKKYCSMRLFKTIKLWLYGFLTFMFQCVISLILPYVCQQILKWLRGYESQRVRWDTRLLHERHQEAPQTAVDMNGDLVPVSQCGDLLDGVHDAVREPRGWPHQLRAKQWSICLTASIHVTHIRRSSLTQDQDKIL